MTRARREFPPKVRLAAWQRSGGKPPVDVVCALLRLDEATGILYWRKRGVEWFRDSPMRSAAHSCAAWNARYADRPALTTPNGKGYSHGSLFGRTIEKHLAAFVIAYGRWPVGEVDHKDLDKGNDRPANLRDGTKAENQRNRGSRGGSSVYCGVFWHRNRWQASAKDRNGEQVRLGRFLLEEEAARAYDAFILQEHGEFARPNFGFAP